MKRIIRADEAQLEAEISKLGTMIDDDDDKQTQTSKWARSYLRQLLSDREKQLSLLRYKNQEASAQAQAG